MGRLPFFIISGASAVGKSTALAAVQKLLPGLHTPHKVTTRAAKSSDRDAEMSCIDDAAFGALQAADGLLLTYKSHGYRYGVVRDDAPAQAYVQVAPATTARELRETASDRYNVIIFRLMAAPAIIRARLDGRGDVLSANDRASRQATAEKGVTHGVDYVINAERDPASVAREIADLIKGYLSPTGDTPAPSAA